MYSLQKRGTIEPGYSEFITSILQNEAISCFHVIQIHFFTLAYIMSSEFTNELVITNLLAQLFLRNN